MSSVNRKMAQGMLWQTGARIGVRGIGLVSTLILARLLTPADFGLVAIAVTAVALLEVFAEFGFSIALVRQQTLTEQDINTAWTLNIGLGVAVCLAIGVAAPWVAQFYGDHRLQPILWVLAFGFLVESARNLHIVHFRREFVFHKDLLLQVGNKLVSVLVSIPTALAFHSYWALVVGVVAGNCATALMSFGLCAQRPRFELTQYRGLVAFSRWTLAEAVLRFFRDRGAALVLGRTMDSHSLGLFSVAQSYASIPTTELQFPIVYSTLPGYSKLAGNAPELRRSYARVLGLVAVVLLPIGFAIAPLAGPIVRLLLGKKWEECAVAFGVLTVSGAIRLLTASSPSVHYALGQPRYHVFVLIVQVVTILPLLLFAGSNWGLNGAAMAILLHSMFIVVPSTFVVLVRTTMISVSDILHPIWRPILSTIAMFGVVRWVSAALQRDFVLPDIALIAIGIAVAVTTYAAAMVVLWFASGRPQGIETTLYSGALGVLARRRTD